MSLLKLEGVSQKYKIKKEKITLFENVNLTVESGEFCVITGPSDCGKSTLLKIIEGIAKPTEGTIIFDEKDINKLSKKGLEELYRDKIAIVNSENNFFEDLSVLENFNAAVKHCKKSLNPNSALKIVGLVDRAMSYPRELSSTQRQSFAIAMAIAKQPKLIICDEPIAAFDKENSTRIIKLLSEACKKINTSVIYATTNSSAAAFADKSYYFEDKTVKESLNK